MNAAERRRANQEVGKLLWNPGFRTGIAFTVGSAHTRSSRPAEYCPGYYYSTGTLSEPNETALAGFIALELCRRQGVSLRFTPTDFSKYKAASEEVRPANARASRSGSPWYHNCRCWYWSEHACW